MEDCKEERKTLNLYCALGLLLSKKEAEKALTANRVSLKAVGPEAIAAWLLLHKVLSVSFDVRVVWHSSWGKEPCQPCSMCTERKCRASQLEAWGRSHPADISIVLLWCKDNAHMKQSFGSRAIHTEPGTFGSETVEAVLKAVGMY